ncbi:MAG TPA: hypothetical protein VGK24_06920 [Candidatus Angelobacter sp.]
MRTFLLFLLSCCTAVALAEKTAPLSKEQLAEISVRGRMLAEYDQAAWHATDAVMATHPKQDSDSRFVCRKADVTWTCVFGRLTADKLLIDYEALQGASAKEFQVKHYEPPMEDTGFFFAAVKGMLLAGKDFQLTAEKRPYNPSVLPTPSGQFYVYIVPAQTKKGIYPLGGDARYLVSADGNTVVEKRQLHKTILETDQQAPAGAKIVAGTHSHVLTDAPEDTDVFYVLTRKPLMPEYIGVGNKRSYVVETDGAIRLAK